MVKTPDEIWRDYNTDGVPSSGRWDPPKPDIREFMNAAYFGAAGSRTVLPNNLTLYVRTDGNDANTGLSDSSNGAFKTIGRALQVAYFNYDLKLYQVKIKVGNGTYTEIISLSGAPPWAATSTVDYPIYIEGNTSTPASVQINGGIRANAGARFGINGFKIFCTTADVTALYSHGYGSAIYTGLLELGQMTGTGDHLTASDGGRWYQMADILVSGGAYNHWHVTEGSFARAASGATTTITGNPTFTGQFVGVAFSEFFCIGHIITGSAQGRRFLVHLNGVIRSGLNNRTIFPGNIIGYEQSGGRLDEGSRFSVNRDGGTSQSVPANTWTKVFWNSANSVMNIGGDFDFTGNRWFARGGIVDLKGQVTFNGGVSSGDLLAISIYKNGSIFKDHFVQVANAASTFALDLNVIDKADSGTDINAYYELFAYSNTAKTISAAPSQTFFMGHNL